MPQQKVVHVMPSVSSERKYLTTSFFRTSGGGDLETFFAGRVEAELARDESFDAGPDNGVNDALLFYEAGGGDGGDDSILSRQGGGEGGGRVVSLDGLWRCREQGFGCTTGQC